LGRDARDDRGVTWVEHQVVDVFIAKTDLLKRILGYHVVRILYLPRSIGAKFEKRRMESTIASLSGVVGQYNVVSHELRDLNTIDRTAVGEILKFSELL
jgi:hypothetical protein